MPSCKHWFCSLCFPNGPRFSPSLWAPQTFVRPPRTARHFAAVPAHHYQTPRPPGLKHFTVPHKRLDCWACGNIPKTFFCAIETPAWKIPAAGSISLFLAATPNCFAARFCVTKGISPANMTFEQNGESELPAFRAIMSHQCVCPSSELSNSISCVYVNVNTVVLTHDELGHGLILSVLID